MARGRSKTTGDHIVLTTKQELFAQLYVKLNDASKAYRQVYNCAKSKDTTIWRNAKELVDNAKVAARIAEIQGKLVEELDISPRRTIEELARIAFADLRQLFDADGNILSLDQWPDNLVPAIQSVKVRQGKNGVVITEVKFWSKIAALDALAKHLGLFEKDNRQKGEAAMSVAEAIAAAQREAERRDRAA